MNPSFSVVGIGAANVDQLWQTKESLRYRDSNPGYLHTSVGGVTRNITENLSRLGNSAAFLTAVGSDANAQKIREDSTAAGINMDYVCIKPDYPSSTYVCLLDMDGDMLLALSDMQVLQHFTAEDVEKNAELILQAQVIVCDGCLPAEALDSLLALTENNVPVFADPVSVAYSKNIRPFVSRLYGIKPNIYELSVLSGKKVESRSDIEKASASLLDAGLKEIVVSLGKEGCYYANRQGFRSFSKLPEISNMVNASGAGDAFLAGFVHGYLHNLTETERIRFALACGAVTVQHEQTVYPQMNMQLIENYLKSID